MAVGSLASAAGAVRPPPVTRWSYRAQGTRGGTRPRVMHRVAVPISPMNLL